MISWYRLVDTILNYFKIHFAQIILCYTFAEKIIDKLIVNILNYASDKHDNKDNKDELYESNVKFDELIDSINKKLTFVTDTVKNLKGSN